MSICCLVAIQRPIGEGLHPTLSLDTYERTGELRNIHGECHVKDSNGATSSITKQNILTLTEESTIDRTQQSRT